MKIWTGHGSEHSSKLVLIGRFESETSVDAAMDRMDKLRDLSEELTTDDDWDSPGRYPEGLFDALRDLGIYDMGQSDVDIYRYEYDAKKSASQIVIETDESEIQGFLKVLLAFGARIEIFSAHDWNRDGSLREADADEDQAGNG